MKTLTALFLLITVGSIQAQTLISEFRFNSNPVTTATVGPNATSVSSSAGSTTGGVASNGLNPKAQGEKQDINLTIPGSPTFDVRGIDISIAYRRNESDAYFFTRGTNMNFGMAGGQLFVTYKTFYGSVVTTINSGGVYDIPSDDTYRTYRFVYNPTNGIGRLQVNGATVWTNDGTDMRNLYWTGAGNVIVGQLMDGNGNNKAVLDNLKIYSITATALPIQLLSFDAQAKKDNTEVALSWATASEENNDYFSIEKSIDGINWVEIKKVQGAGNSSQQINYTTTDENPRAGVQYYRLKQVDFDGKSETFKDIPLQISSSSKIKISAFPNPTNGSFTLVSDEIQDAATTQISISNAMGNIIFQQTDTHEYKTNIDISNFPAGTYTVEVICDGQVARLLIAKN